MRGRIRIRIPEKRRDARYFAYVRERLSTCDGVEAVTVNPLAASVLITGQTTSTKLLAFAERTELFVVARPEPPRPPLSERAAANLERLDGRVRTASDGQLDLSGLAMMGLVGATLWQVSRRRILPEALTILWYAAMVALPGKKPVVH
jgi:hypothetical protein